jgi:hypothetical protein
MWTTFRATRDAWLKAINTYALSYTGCATCSGTIIGNVDTEITNVYNDYLYYIAGEEYGVAYATFYNMVTGLYRFPGVTVLEHNTAFGCDNPLPDNFSFAAGSEYCLFTGLHNVPIIDFITNAPAATVTYVNDVDFGDGNWNFEFFENYVNSLIQADCFFMKFLNLTTGNLIKESEMTNFNQIV